MDGKVKTDAELAGLDEKNLEPFLNMGFERPHVVRTLIHAGERVLMRQIATLKRLNYRGNNVANIHESVVRFAQHVTCAG